MKRLNFNSLKNISVPQSWIEKALAVPDNYRREKTIKLNKFSRIGAYAACLALACGVGLPFLSPNNNYNPPTAVKSNPSTVDGSSATEATKNRYPKDGDETTSTTGGDVKIKRQTTDSQSVNTNLGFPELRGTEPTVEITSDVFLNPEGTDSDKKSVFKELQNTIPEKTQGYTTNRETQQQTTSPYSEETTTGSPHVTETSPHTKPSGWADVEGINICEGDFSPELLTGRGRVYCRLYDGENRLLGDKNLFSNEHAAKSFIISSGMVHGTYDPAEAGLSLSPDKYTFYFYNEDGTDIFLGYLYVA